VNLIFIRFVNIIMFRLVIFLLLCTCASAHEVRLRIIDAEHGRPMSGVTVRYGDQGTISSTDGVAILRGIERVTRVTCTSVGYDTVMIDVSSSTRQVDVPMRPSMVGTGPITIRADRSTEREAFERPVLTEVTTAAQLTSVAATSLADGLSYQPGLRLETDCRNCGFTQARMNGLPGGARWPASMVWSRSPPP
jgi:outer membrane receptor for ferrienterochelin and colicins